VSRVQLALNVSDIDEAVAFYTTLFGTEPAKRKPGYANFAIAEPPLKLVLLENPGQGGSLNHLGVEVTSPGAVDAEHTRLTEAGVAPGPAELLITREWAIRAGENERLTATFRELTGHAPGTVAEFLHDNRQQFLPPAA